MTISAAALVSLWGDELAEVNKARLGNTKMPGREDKVSTRDLATAELALTVFDLWCARALDVAFERKKRLGFNTAKVMVQAIAAPAFPFAAALAGACRERRPIEPALQDALGGEQSDAATTVVTWVQHELAGAGILADPAVASAHRGAWEELKARWLQWQQGNPADAELLLKESRSALTYATASD